MSVESPPFATANSTFGAEITRRAITSLLQRGATIGSITGGIVSPTDCQVAAGTGMTCTISPGEAWVPGGSSSTQGGYYSRVSATDTETISAADPTNPRIDRICLQVNDKAYAGSVDSLVPLVVTGVPSAGATLSNLVGAGSVPASALLLANVLVPASSSSISNGNIANVATVVSLTQFGGSTAALVTGTDSSKPAAAATNKAELYQGTDSGALYLSDGSNLRTVYGSRAAVNIATSQSRTNTSYGTLTTPDQVTNIVLPTNGLIAVWYQATWQESVQGAASAAIFLGSNQLKIAGNDAPVVQAATTNSTKGGNLAVPLTTYAQGLVSIAPDTGYTGNVTTGQIVGGTSGGGPCYIFAAAGTYTVSVQFKATSGSVTAVNRTLWTQAVPFA